MYVTFLELPCVGESIFCPAPVPQVVRVPRDETVDTYAVFHAQNLAYPIPQPGPTAFVPPGSLRAARWAYDGWFYLMFLPLHDRMNSRFLKIDYRPSSLQLREHRHPNKFGHKDTVYWGLAEDVCKHLSSVYRATLALNSELVAFARIPLPLHLRMHTLTDEYIWRLFERPGQAISHGMRIRSILYAGFALSSFLVSQAWDHDDFDHKRARCIDHLTSRDCKRDNLPPSFVEGLLDTWVFDLTQLRIGAYVDITQPMSVQEPEFASTTWFRALDKILHYATGVPIALLYPGDRPVHSDACPVAFKFFPTVVDPIPDVTTALPTSPRFASPTLPPLPRQPFDTYGPTACRTMSLLEWLVGLKIYSAAVIANESPAERERRCRRERENADQPIPSRGGSSVFEWATASIDDSWSCLCVSQRNDTLAALWGSTTPAQHIYSSVLNEYHIWPCAPDDQPPKVFHESAYDDDDDDEPLTPSVRQTQYALYDYDVAAPVPSTSRQAVRQRSRSPRRSTPPRVQDNPILVDHPRLSPLSGLTSSSVVTTSTRHEIAVEATRPDRNDLRRTLLDMVTPDDAYLYTPIDSLADFVRLRLRVVIPNPENFNPQPHGEPPLDPRKAKQRLGFREKHHADLTQYTWEVLCVLVKILGVVHTLDTMCDTEASAGISLAVLLDTPPRSFTPPLATLDRGRSSFVIAPKSFDNQDFYVLRRRGLPEKSVPWTIVLEDPLTALEVVRRGWGPSTVDVARELCTRGIPFHTVVRCEKALPAVPKHRGRLGLGLFRAGYKPDQHDYAAYEARCQELLRRHGFLRAALLKGGIIWRLVLAVLGFDDIIGGPSMSALNPFVIELDGEWVLDDDLTAEEMDIICGVCRIRTGMLSSISYWMCRSLIFDSGINTSDASLSSWWPRHDVWMKSNYNDGHWTWRDEVWFRERLEKIRCSTHTVRPAGEWKSSIKGEPEWGRMQNNLKTLARAFIHRSFGEA